MDIRDRVMGDPPDSFLHKIAGIIPGYTGYVDRERTRDADRLLRTQLARRYSEQRDRLTRVQQDLMRNRRMDELDDIERLSGLLQRFTDRLSTATYGYTGLFDPVRIEAQDLDQLYAFDMALASGVEEVSGAIDSLEGEGGAGDLPASVSRLEGILDNLNRRLNERTDLLTSGRRLAQNDYQSLVSDLSRPESSYSTSSPYTPTPGVTSAEAGSTARYPGNPPESEAGRAGITGQPTYNLNTSASQPSMPGTSSISEGNQGFVDQPTEVTMGDRGPGEIPRGGSAGTGIETASSPATAPGAPGGDIVEGLDMANRMGTPETPGTGPGGANPPEKE